MFVIIYSRYFIKVLNPYTVKKNSIRTHLKMRKDAENNIARIQTRFYFKNVFRTPPYCLDKPADMLLFSGSSVGRYQLCHFRDN